MHQTRNALRIIAVMVWLVLIEHGTQDPAVLFNILALCTHHRSASVSHSIAVLCAMHSAMQHWPVFAACGCTLIKLMTYKYCHRKNMLEFRRGYRLQAALAASCLADVPGPKRSC